MKLVLTGATGTIGRFLIPELLREGHSVVHLGRGELREEFPQVDWRKVDFETCSGVEAHAFAGAGAVLHMANLTKEDPELDRRAAKFLFAEAAKQAVPHFFYASSIRVYGDALGVLEETSEPSPCASDEYGRSKLATERLLREAENGSGTKLRVLRIGHVITPARRRELHYGARSMLLWGRGYTHHIAVNQVVNAILFLLKGNPRHGIYNVTVDTAARTLRAQFGQNSLAARFSLPLPVSRLVGTAAEARETRGAWIRHASLEAEGWIPPEAKIE
jgi:nucleoside-diphosphate-sugar epimerase